MSFTKLMEPNYSNKYYALLCGRTNRFNDSKRTIKQKKFVVGSPQSAVKGPTVKHLSSLPRTANSHTWSSRYSRLCQVFIVFMNCGTRLPLTLILEKTCINFGPKYHGMATFTLFTFLLQREKSLGLF